MAKVLVTTGGSRGIVGVRNAGRRARAFVDVAGGKIDRGAVYDADVAAGSARSERNDLRSPDAPDAGERQGVLHRDTRIDIYALHRLSVWMEIAAGSITARGTAAAAHSARRFWKCSRCWNQANATCSR